jgi:hypothetical protein
MICNYQISCSREVSRTGSSGGILTQGFQPRNLYLCTLDLPLCLYRPCAINHSMTALLLTPFPFIPFSGAKTLVRFSAAFVLATNSNSHSPLF